jgi:glycosyl transferase family 92
VAPYLAIGAIYRDEAPYLREWIEFHRLMGVERLFLYNNRSTDDHLEVLAPYIEDGTVVWEDWPIFPVQLEAYQSCVETHRHDARWIAFIDVDEFLFSPTGRSLPDVLRDFEEHPGVGVNTLVFGTSGHQTPPAGLVVENYTRRLGVDRPRTGAIKSIVDPTRVLKPGKVPHYFHYAGRQRAVNERFEPIQGHVHRPPSVDLLRINHYFTRSQVERERKLRALRADAGVARNTEGVEERDLRLNEAEDETLAAYAPAIREALQARAAAPR